MRHPAAAFAFPSALTVSLGHRNAQQVRCCARTAPHALRRERVVSMSTPAPREDQGKLAGDMEFSSGSAGAGAGSVGSSLFAIGASLLGSFVFGYHLAVVNGALDAMSIEFGFQSDALMKGYVVSSALLGALLGSLGAGALVERYGLRKAIIFNSFKLFAAACLCAAAVTPSQLLAGRLLSGVGIGVTSVLTPLYVAENAPAELKARIGSYIQVFINIGIVAALVAAIPIAAHPSWWRTMFGLSAIPVVLQALGIFLFDSGAPTHAYDMARESPGTETGVSGKESVSWMQGLKGNWQPATVGIALFALQQWSGINAVVFFSSSIFREAGIQSTALASVVVNASNIGGTLLAGNLIGAFGKRTMLSISFAGMFVSLVLLGAANTSSALMDVRGPLSVLGTLAYVVSFAFGCGPVPQIVLPELFPRSWRSQGTSLGFASHWLFNFALGLAFLPLVQRLGVGSVNFLFAAVCFLGVLFTQKFIPP
ncbi:Plastidic glucose transporter 4 [Porphyridium purpureum]|uniref:Plastidic glucose transporter 4 n=1 Tax=Porphyridium purpureum TaxID=35688 RepID=A0A5J4YJ19_PORPP|nr:Plastidic glucose transporter 4 [Porphyridium purpureum]|eukprot:POR6941..scf251_18